MRTVNLILALLTVFSVVASAQGGKGKHKEMRKELKAYRETNMTPVLKAQRAKLEKDLSASEKSVIADVRKAVEADREANKGMRKDIRKTKKAGGELTEAQKAKMQEAKDARKKHMEALKPIAERHRETIKALNEEIAPQKEKWKADRQAIKAKHLTEAELKEMEAKRAERRENRKAKHPHRHGKSEGKKGAKAMKFLLLDPDS